VALERELVNLQVGPLASKGFMLTNKYINTDLLHSYLGLVALALFDEPGLDKVDAAMCATTRVESHLESLAWWRAE
jgi:prenyltransferase beta subunit